MRLITLHERETIAAWLSQNADLNIYQIGDLDAFFWPSTLWYGLEQAGAILHIGLVYLGHSMPIWLMFDDQRQQYSAQLAAAMRPLLPTKVYCHFSPGIAEGLADRYQLHDHGLHHKMILRDFAKLDQVRFEREVVQLSGSDLPAINQLYAAAYPDNAFDQRMLETGCCYGIWQDDQLISIAGIHVYSPRYRVAALGNITTHPAYRGQGLAKQVTAKLCQHLRHDINHIGLNVHSANHVAIKTYENLGFSWVADYSEVLLEQKA
ncbi:GNAT family N-acetyltransferase [Herpetosiphon llansteffanensis]